MLCKEKLIETIEKSIVTMEYSMKTMEKQWTLQMANFSFKIQQSTCFAPTYVANSKEKQKKQTQNKHKNLHP